MVKRVGSVDPSKFPDEEFDLYSIPAYDRGSPEVLAGADIGSSKQLVSPGDVLLSRIVPHIRRAWIVGRSRGRRIIASGEWIVFRSDSTDPRWLRHYLLADSFHRQFMQTVAGVGGSLLRARPAQVATIQVAVPGLDEQNRVAAILDRADAIRVKRNKVVAQIDKLTEAAFDSAFGTNLHNPATTLGEIADVSSGITKGRKTADRTTPTPYLAVANVQAGYLNLGQVKEIEATQREIERYALVAGDIVLTEGGDPDKLGRGTVWREELPLCLHQNHIFRVRMRDSQLHPEYLSAYLASKPAKSYFLRSAKQTTGIASINMTQLRGTPIYVPSQQDQQRYINCVREIGALRVTAAAEAGSLDELFVSLQSSVFSGRL